MDDLLKIIGQMLGKKTCWPLNGGKKTNKQYTCDSKRVAAAA